MIDRKVWGATNLNQYIIYYNKSSIEKKNPEDYDIQCKEDYRATKYPTILSFFSGIRESQKNKEAK